MKKTFKISILSILVFAIFTLVGCSNADKTLAKNLDNTITNLIYSVTNLDFVDSSQLESLSVLDTQEQTNNIVNNNDSNTQKNANCCENNANIDANQQFERNIQNYKLSENMSGHPNFRNEFGTIPIRKAYENQIYNTYGGDQNKFNNTYANNQTRQNVYNYNQQNIVNDSTQSDDTQNKNETIRLVTFSTDKISENNKELQNLITSLINKRSNLLLYVNDLYKGNISIVNPNRNAVNAYMNIIKDNTAYFNQHRGIVTNQIDQAKEILQNDQSSALVNAYIIRTNEAISTRITKLESSISAIESIFQILKGSEKNSFESYMLDKFNNQNNTSINNEAQNNISNDSINYNRPTNTENPDYNNESLNNYGYIPPRFNPHDRHIMPYPYHGFEIENNTTENINIPEQNNNTTIPTPIINTQNTTQANNNNKPNDTNKNMNNMDSKTSNLPENNNVAITNNEQSICNIPYQSSPDNTKITSLTNQNNNTSIKNQSNECGNEKCISNCNKDNCCDNGLNQNWTNKNQKAVALNQTFSNEQNNIKTEKISQENEIKSETRNDQITSYKSEVSETKKDNNDKKKNIKKLDNNLNEKIREEQKEIRETKNKFDEKLKTNKISKMFLEDKNNRHSRLKTMNTKQASPPILDKPANIEKAQNIPYLAFWCNIINIKSHFCDFFILFYFLVFQ